jgi:hypothetical protein
MVKCDKVDVVGGVRRQSKRNNLSSKREEEDGGGELGGCQLIANPKAADLLSKYPSGHVCKQTAKSMT